MRKYKYPDVLKRFMLEMFDFDGLVKAGLFEKEWKEDYEKQAEKICWFFGYESVFEYGAKPFVGHVSYVSERPEWDKNFITVRPSIYDD